MSSSVSAPSLSVVWQWKTPVTSAVSTSIGEFVLVGGLDLAGVFAQLRRDVGAGQAPKRSASSRQATRPVVPGQLVLVELEAARLSAAPHLDVVFLAAGEVVQGERKLLVVDHAQIGLHHEAMPSDPAAMVTLDLVSPRPRTWATPGRPTKRSMIGPASSALTRTSMSLMVSFRRRRLPQTSMRLDAGRVAQGVEQGQGDGLGLVDAHAVGRAS